MSKQSLTNYIEQIPRWALVALALYGVIGIRDLHEQIKSDHMTVIQHSADIAELRSISKKLSEIIQRNP